MSTDSEIERLRRNINKKSRKKGVVSSRKDQEIDLEEDERRVVT